MRKENGEFARELRKHQTEAECLLWRKLRARQFMGLKFRRQYPLPPYVLDFYCAERSLIIELDGGQHAVRAGYDRQRSDFLEAQGLMVLRFWNGDVMMNMDDVLEHIRLQLENRPSPRPSPRERGEGENGALMKEE